MQFVALKFGDRNGIFPLDSAVSIPFAFARPATRADALLQGFRLSYDGSDDFAFEVARVELFTRFEPGATSGTVEAHFTLNGAASDLGLGPVAIHAELQIVVVGT